MDFTLASALGAAIPYLLIDLLVLSLIAKKNINQNSKQKTIKFCLLSSLIGTLGVAGETLSLLEKMGVSQAILETRFMIVSVIAFAFLLLSFSSAAFISFKLAKKQLTYLKTVTICFSLMLLLLFFRISSPHTTGVIVAGWFCILRMNNENITVLPTRGEFYTE